MMGKSNRIIGLLSAAALGASVLTISQPAMAENLTWWLNSSSYQTDYVEGSRYSAGSRSNTFSNPGDGADNDYGNARIFRSVEDVNQEVRVSSYSARRQDNTTGGAWNSTDYDPFETAYTGRWGGGIGANNQYDDGTGSNNQHTVDNMSGKDLVLFEFETAMAMNEALLTMYSCGCGNLDSDLSIWVGSNAQAFTGNLSLVGLDFDDLSGTLGLTRLDEDWYSYSSGDNPRTASFNPAPAIEGNILILASSINDSTPEDKFKIKMVGGKLGNGTSVPAPGGLGVVLLGLAAIGFMRRKSAPAAV